MFTSTQCSHQLKVHINSKSSHKVFCSPQFNVHINLKFTSSKLNQCQTSSKPELSSADTAAGALWNGLACACLLQTASLFRATYRQPRTSLHLCLSRPLVSRPGWHILTHAAAEWPGLLLHVVDSQTGPTCEKTADLCVCKTSMVKEVLILTIAICVTCSVLFCQKEGHLTEIGVCSQGNKGKFTDKIQWIYLSLPDHQACNWIFGHQAEALCGKKKNNNKNPRRAVCKCWTIRMFEDNCAKFVLENTQPQKSNHWKLNAGCTTHSSEMPCGQKHTRLLFLTRREPTHLAGGFRLKQASTAPSKVSRSWLSM